MKAFLNRCVFAFRLCLLWCGFELHWGIAMAEEPRVFAHYIPWFSNKEVSGGWGWHWTMNAFNPETFLPNGQRSAAAHDYPLLGLYDCADPAVLECQVLQMKFAGIRGVIIDWYGTKAFNDYEMIHRNTQLLLPFLKKAGLQFAVCYEDQSLKHMVAGGALQKSEALTQAQGVMDWLAKNWFNDDAYLKLDGRPLLLVFGPQYLNKTQWAQLWPDWPVKPLLIAMPHLAKDAGADGIFGWPPVTGGKEILPEVWRKYIADLRTRSAAGELVVATVFPGFRDIYQEAGLHGSYGSIDERGGETFKETLELALSSGSQVVQVATWNDYGEGTVIEPTWRLGYTFLEVLQKRLAKQSGQQGGFSPQDLGLPQELFEARRKASSNHSTPVDTKEKLGRISDLLFEGRCAEARRLLNELR